MSKLKSEAVHWKKNRKYNGNFFLNDRQSQQNTTLKTGISSINKWYTVPALLVAPFVLSHE